MADNGLYKRKDLRRQCESQMKVLETTAADIRPLMSQLLVENDRLELENVRLMDEMASNGGNDERVRQLNEELATLTIEMESLKIENQSVTEERDMARKELREIRHENDMLLNKLNQSDQTNHNMAHSLISSLVHSLPEFSQQFGLLTDRPNSVNTFGSFSQMDGLRPKPSLEDADTYHSAVPSNPNSNDTFYTAEPNAQSVEQSSASAAATHVMSQKLNTLQAFLVDQQLNQSMTATTESSQSFGFDRNENLKLKLVKVPINKNMAVTVAYVESPSDFWLHINSLDVNRYIHEIQTKQGVLIDRGTAKLSPADVEIGMYLAAIYSADGYWYRGQVVDIHYGNDIEKDSIRTVCVQFIDWGNTEEVPLNNTMRLSVELHKRKQAIHCYLQGLGSKIHKWTKESIKSFKDMLENAKSLSTTFQKGHPLDERLESYKYPADLLMIDDSGQTINVCDLVMIPEWEEQPSLPFNDSVCTTTTLTPVLDDIPTPNLAPNIRFDENASSQKSKKSSVDNTTAANREMSKSNQNCLTTSSSNQKIDNNLIGNTLAQTHPKSLPNQLNSALSTDLLRIPEPIVPDSNNGLIVEPSTVINPSLFYVHIIDTTLTGIAQFEDMEERLNELYSETAPKHMQTHAYQVKMGSFWVTQYTEDKRWYRCRVLDVIADKALVNYVDYGNEEWVSCRDLIPLTRTFSVYPAMAVRCCLSNISPLESSTEWPEETAQWFRQLLQEESKALTAFIGPKPDPFDFDSTLELFLWANVTKEIDNEGEPQEEEILINAYFVINGLAVTDNIEWVREAERALRELTPPQVMNDLVIPLLKNPNNTTVTINESLISSVADDSAPKLNGNHSLDEVAVSLNVTNTLSSNAQTLVSIAMNGQTSNDQTNHTSNGLHSSQCQSPKANGWPPQEVNKCLTNGYNVFPELIDSEDDGDWDPMADDARNYKNDYSVVPDDPSVAVLNYKIKDQMTCKYYGVGSGCHRGDLCKFLHVDPKRRLAMNDEEEEGVEVAEPELMRGSCVFLQVTSVKSPTSFYATLPFGRIDVSADSTQCPKDTQLNQLSKRMKDYYMRNKPKENLNIYHGLASLVVYRDELTGNYYRARVVDEDIDEQECMLFAIDVGTVDRVKRNCFYKLEPFFYNTPALAIHCSLANIEPLGTDHWPQPIIKTFQDMTLNKLFYGHIVYGETDGKYYVDLVEKDTNDRLSQQLIVKQLAQKINMNVTNGPLMATDDEDIYNSDYDD